jgi:hypothetical protein
MMTTYERREETFEEPFEIRTPGVQPRPKAMKRLQFGLRLLLLLITLLATCSAWIGAIRSREQSEREIARMRFEAILASEERWHATLLEAIERAPGDPQFMPRKNGLAEIKNTRARIAAVRKQLDLVK